MVSKGLIEFMRNNFGDRCLRILNEVHHKIGVEDVEEASIEDKKNFIIEMQPLLRDKDIANSEILTTELMNLLNVNIYESNKYQLGISKNDKMMIKEYIEREGERKIRSGLEEMNSLITLYMNKTSKALKKGITKKTITTNTEKVLRGLKKNMLSIGREIEQKSNVNLSLPFIQKKMRDLQERGDMVDVEKIREQTELARALKEYMGEIEEMFEEYKAGFLKNLEKKIYLEKQGLPSDYIVRQTKEISDTLFSKMMDSYTELKRKLTV
ncbi:MAG: hypothetical protein ACLFSL_04150 [Candidatus Woesearchaeota archaeon]